MNGLRSCKHANAPQDTVTAERYERDLLQPKERAEQSNDRSGKRTLGVNADKLAKLGLTQTEFVFGQRQRVLKLIYSRLQGAQLREEHLCFWSRDARSTHVTKKGL